MIKREGLYKSSICLIFRQMLLLIIIKDQRFVHNKRKWFIFICNEANDIITKYNKTKLLLPEQII